MKFRKEDERMGEYFKKSDLVRSLFDYMDGKKSIGQCIDDCPVIDLATYEWRLDGRIYRCSRCNYPSESKTNFCPNCGADLRARG